MANSTEVQLNYTHGKRLTLGLFGFGCVGQGLYHVLHETKGLKAEIKKICVKDRGKSRSIDHSFFTFDKFEILNDTEIDVVVELIDDADAAFEIVKLALEHGKHVVTANKKMLAEHLEEIYQLQQLYNRSVLYEGAVCGSIPIIRNLEEYYDNDLIKGIEGIFNGSTNYILTKVFEENMSYSDAVTQAQELGFAESDPSLDVEGFDPKFKLTIAIAHAFGVFTKPENVINLGINKIHELDLKYARDNSFHIKLVSRAIKVGNIVYGLVAPQFVNASDTLSSIKNEFNAVSVEGAFSERQLFVGKGAGGYPTGSAVLSDISALSYNYRYEYKKRSQSKSESLVFSNDVTVEVFVRFESGADVSISDLSEFKSGYAGNGQQYLVGRATFSQLVEWSKNEKIGIILSSDPGFAVEEIESTLEQELVA